MQSSYRQLSMTQSVAAGSPVMSSPFTSGYFDPKFAKGDFPQPLGTSSMRSAAQTQAPQSFSSPPATAAHAPVVPQQPKKKPSAFEQFCQDKLARILLLAWAALTFAICAYTLWLTATTVSRLEFRVVSELGWDSWCGSLMVSLVFLAVLALLGLPICGSAFVVGVTEGRSALRMFETAASVLGFVTIIATVVLAVQGERCRPDVVRTANLICQETDVWGCGTTAAAGRRLGLGSEAVAFEKDIRATLGLENTTMLCSFLEEMCAAPADLDVNTSCICAGNWDLPVTPTAPTATVGRRLRDIKAEFIAPFPRRLAENPWTGTMGAFCDTWGGATDGDWCFVAPSSQCTGAPKSLHKSSRGVDLFVSAGPCKDSVDSRSQLVLVGFEMLWTAVKAAGVEGVAMIVMAILAAVLARFPSKETSYQQISDAPQVVPQATPQPYDLQMRFEDAQREAVRKLSDQTPGDVKLMLYGFYQQAQKGDVHPEEPGYMAKPAERQKYQYWARHRGLSTQEAMEGYIRTVALL